MHPGFFTALGIRARSPRGFILAMCCMLLFGLCAPVQAKRIALVIGNDAYASVEKLKNARNDARLIASVLTQAGFGVTQANDLGREGLWSTIDAFKSNIGKGDEVVFYFAGHGIQIGSTQLLLPTDINPKSEAQVQRDGVPLIEVQDAFKDARVAIFIIDACRDNPFPKQGTCYVSGYFYAANEPDLASHAWADICLDVAQRRWVSIDITHSCLIDQRHVRLAMGTDYDACPPIKGVRQGGGEESMTVSITIELA